MYTEQFNIGENLKWASDVKSMETLFKLVYCVLFRSSLPLRTNHSGKYIKQIYNNVTRIERMTLSRVIDWSPVLFLWEIN